MKTYVAGTLVRLSAALTLSASGSAVDATMAVKVKGPDGAVTSLTAVRDTQGNYHADFTTADLGLHRYEWVASGGAVAAGVGQFLVTQGTF